MKETKICTKCGEEKPIEMFSVSNYQKSRLSCQCKKCCAERDKKYRDSNKERKKEYLKEYYLKNKQKVLERNKRYRESNEEKKIEYGKRYYQQNTDRHKASAKQWTIKNKEKMREYHKKYKKENNELINTYTQKRRAIKKQLPATLTIKEWEENKAEFGGVCCYCGKKEKLTQEHVKASSKGGGYTKNNILPACITCNTSKQNKDFLVWYRKQKFYNKEREKKIIRHIMQNK